MTALMSGAPTWETRRLLWDLVRAQPGLYVLDAALQLPRQTIFLATGLLTRAYFDTLTGQAPFVWGVPGVVVLLLAAAVARIALVFGAVAADATFQYTAYARLRHRLLARLLARPAAAAAAGHAPGEAVSRLVGDAQEAARFLSTALTRAGRAMLGVAAVALMARTDPLVTAVACLPLVGVGLLGGLAGGRVREYRLATREAAGRASALIADAFGAVQAIQAAGAEEAVAARFRALGVDRRRSAVRDRRLTALVGAAGGVLAGLGTGLVLLLAAQALQRGALTVGDFALFVYFLPWVSDAVAALGELVAGSRQAGASVARLAGLWAPPPPSPTAVAPAPTTGRSSPASTPPAGTRARPATLEVLEAEGLSYVHQDGRQALEAIGFRLERGGFLAVTGRVGAGKSTLLRVLVGQLPRSGGVIRWNGDPVDDPFAFFVPPRCATTPQGARLFTDSLQDNLLLGWPTAAGDMAAAIWTAVLDGDVAALPRGLDTPVGPRGLTLSGGQVQRAATARALVREPELLVLDDPTSALDAGTERAFWERLLARPQTTCVASTHAPAALQRADEVLVLKDGRLEGRGTFAHLLATCEEFRRLQQDDRPGPSAPRAS